MAPGFAPAPTVLLRRLTQRKVRRDRPIPIRVLIRRLWPYARPYRKWLVVLLALSAITPVVEAGTVWIFRRVIDDVLIPQATNRVAGVLTIMALITAADAVLSFADHYLTTRTGTRFLVDLRSDVFRHLLTLSPDFYDRQPLGDVLTRLSGDTSAIEEFVLTNVRRALSIVVRIVVLTAAVMILDSQLAMVSMVVAPLFLTCARSYARRTRGLARERRHRTGLVSNVAEEVLANTAVVQACGSELHEQQRFREQLDELARADLRVARLSASYRPMIDLLELIGGGLAIWIGVHHLQSGRLTFRELIVFITFLTQLFSPLRGLGRLSGSAASAAASAERVLELLDTRPAVVDLPCAYDVPASEGEVEFTQVSFTYPGASRPALRDVSFRARPGQVVAIVGPSGAGKSTLARLLMRWYEPSSGDIRLDGHAFIRSVRLPSAVTSPIFLRRPSFSMRPCAPTCATAGGRHPRRK